MQPLPLHHFSLLFCQPPLPSFTSDALFEWPHNFVIHNSFSNKTVFFSEARVHLHILKNSCSKSFWKLPSKIFMVESFLCALAYLPVSFPKSYSAKNLPVECSCKEKLHSRSIRNFRAISERSQKTFFLELVFVEVGISRLQTFIIREKRGTFAKGSFWTSFPMWSLPERYL